MGFQGGETLTLAPLPKLARRPLSALLVLLGILIIDFALIQATDTQRLRQENLDDKSVSPEEMEKRLADFRREFDLDRPIPRRFASWLGNIVQLEFGHSMTDPRSVRTIVGLALGKSLWLQIPAILLFFLVGIPLGVFMAGHAGGLVDRVLGTTLLGIYAMPTFWLGTLLLIYGATASGLDLFPLEGLSSEDALGGSFWLTFKDRIAHLFLPTLALSLPGITAVARQTRSAMLETLGSDYILAARAAGVAENRVVWVHALRHSLIPAATLLGLLLPQVVGGSVVIEKIFNIRGMGLLLLESAQNRDFPVLQTLVLLSAILTLIGFVVSDFLNAKLVPRTRTS